MQFVYLWDFRSFFPSLCTHNTKHFHHPIVSSNKSSTVMCIHLYGWIQEMSKNYQTYGTLEAILNGANKKLTILIIITANTSLTFYRLMSKTCMGWNRVGERIFDCSLRSRLRPSKPHFVQITEMLLTSLRWNPSTDFQLEANIFHRQSKLAISWIYFEYFHLLHHFS